jgi:hypothetical protein
MFYTKTNALKCNPFKITKLIFLVLILIQSIASICLSVKLNNKIVFLILTPIIAIITLIGLIKNYYALLYANTIVIIGYCSYLFYCLNSSLKVFLIAITIVNIIMSLIIAIIITINKCNKKSMTQNRLREEVANLALPITTISGNCSMPQVLRKGYENYVDKSDENENCLIINADSLQYHI